ncbi:XRE family transcriptional regulator [Lactobacillaceae bacterium L1_55_11]|nr:XRE family transcriptional regulator [Lactobacillaceae bacterium L1_55_11]
MLRHLFYLAGKSGYNGAMLNIQLLQQLSGTKADQVAEIVAADNWQQPGQLDTRQIEKLCRLFSDHFDQLGQFYQSSAHPIHLRITADYLFNLGLTSSDWITLRWALEGQWDANEYLAVGFFQGQELQRLIATDAELLAAFASYLILDQDGRLEPYVDEHHDNQAYDWRIVRTDGQNYQDITTQLVNGTPTEMTHES